MLVLAFVVSYAILDGACRVRAAHQGPSRVAWLVGGSLVIGLSIWAMHFVALLSLRATLPMTEDPVTLGVAAVTAVVAAGGAPFPPRPRAGGGPAAGGVRRGEGVSAGAPPPTLKGAPPPPPGLPP